MKLYLEPSLAAHRHGRFFSAQLEAIPAETMPDAGIMLMHGKRFQALEASQQETWWQWVSEAGRVLLLLPPFEADVVFKRLDWQMALRDEVNIGSDSIVPDILSTEVTLKLAGSDGDLDYTFGHQWTDFTANTRYFKQHNGCGVFAATCLPLWSVSLLDHAQDTLNWLAALLTLAGKAAVVDSAAIPPPAVQLRPTDYTLMVCIQAWGVNTAEAIVPVVTQGTMSLISIPEPEVIEGLARLRRLAMVDDTGLTDAGVNTLHASPYARYVEPLKEEVPYERH